MFLLSKKGILINQLLNLCFSYSTYKPITSYEQRCQYKRDFQSEYPEYIELKKNVDAVTSKFIELDASWRRTEKGTKEYEVKSVFNLYIKLFGAIDIFTLLHIS